MSVTRKKAQAMKKQTSVTLLRLFGSLVGLLAIIAVICLVGLLFAVSGLPHPEKQMGLLGTTAVITLFLCGLTVLLFHKARILEAQLSLAEQTEMAVKRTRAEYILFGLACFGLGGLLCTYLAVQNIYDYAVHPAFARSISPVSFWGHTLLDGSFGIVQLVMAGNLLRSSRSAPSDTPTIAA